VTEPYDADEGPIVTQDDRSVDPLLLNFVRRVNLDHDRSGVGIGLCVHGKTVTGTMISVYAWQQMLFGFDEDDAVDGEDVRLIRAALANEEAVHQAEAAVGLDTPPRFLHLRDAVIIEGNCRLNIGLWRGHLNAIDAWFLGADK
jgi:hypothetical protein